MVKLIVFKRIIGHILYMLYFDLPWHLKRKLTRDNKYEIILLIRLYGKGKGNVLFNDALNTFYLRLYLFRYMVKDHSGSERGNPLPPLHWLLFSISSKGYFICIIPQTG